MCVIECSGVKRSVTYAKNTIATTSGQRFALKKKKIKKKLNKKTPLNETPSALFRISLFETKGKTIGLGCDGQTDI